MNGSDNTNSSPAGARRSVALEAVLFAGLLLLAVLAGNYQPGKRELIWQAGDVRFAAGDNPGYALPGMDDQDWAAVEADDISVLEETSWLRTEVAIEAGRNPIPPYALFLSGPLSAQAYWDGQLLGSKGEVGNGSTPEIPGPIDAVLYIPEALSTSGVHHLALRMSSEHVGYQAQTLLHALAVGSYQSDPRRQLRYYALPMILSGGFLLLALQFGRMYYSTGSASALALSAMAAFVLLQLGSEISRSVVAYTYDWHLWRSLGIWLFACAAGFSLNALVYARAGIRHKGWLMATLAAVLLVSYLVSGFDHKAIAAIYLLAIAPLLTSLMHLRRGRPDLVLVAAGLLGLAWLVGGEISRGALLDGTFYFTCIIFLTAVWFWTSRGNESIDSPRDSASSPAHFFIKHTGRTERLPAGDVLYLRAAGNYTELVCADGRVVLHHQRLGQIMEQPPKSFMRVHRSHAVNLARTTGLRSLEGSRYLADLGADHQVPVSRYQAREVRAMLKGSV